MKRLILCLFALCFLLPAETQAAWPPFLRSRTRSERAEKAAKPTKAVVKVVKDRGAVPSASHNISIESLTWKCRPEIEPVYDERFTDEEDLPDMSDAFVENGMVDVWKKSVSDIKDTTRIDLRGYVHPWKGKVTSNFGLRRWRMHHGIDIKLLKGDSVRCAFDGIVRIAKSVRGGYGRYIVVRHFNGLETVYGHLSKHLAFVGDTLRAGDVLGLGGNTGRSTGSHLHFEFRYLGLPLNPNDLVDFEEFKVKNSFYFVSADSFKYKTEYAKNIAKYWKVRKGDTLGRISRKTGVSINRLCKLNRIKRSSVLRIGQRLRLME